MLKIGETIQYSGNGVCVVDDIRDMDFGSGNVKYYVLRPVSSGYNTFYIPVDNEKMLSKIRKVLTLDEVNDIIGSMPESDAQWIENDQLRKEQYKKIIGSGDCREIVKVIKAIHFHKESLKEQGRKLHMVDEFMLKDAENLLYDEFAAVLNIEKDEVLPFIIKSIEN